MIKRFRDGVALFILSEVIFFLLFWTFFHNALRPSCELGIRWPPPGIRTPNPSSTSLFETGLLIRRGLFVTQAHKRMRLKDYDVGPFIGLVVTIVCGTVFFWYNCGNTTETPILLQIGFMVGFLSINWIPWDTCCCRDYLANGKVSSTMTRGVF